MTFLICLPQQLLRILASLLALVLPLTLTPAYAEKADRDQPLSFEAGKASYDDLKQTYFLSGRVILTKGSMMLKSETAQVHIDPEGHEHAIATATAGNLVFLKQKTDNPDEFIEGYGERVEYDAKTDVTKLIGKARLKRLSGKTVLDDIQGKLIIRDGIRATYQAQGQTGQSGSGEDQRARATISPRNVKPSSR